MKDIRDYAIINGTEEYVPKLFDKKLITRFLKFCGAPMDEIKRIDWEPCEYDENRIEFHNPEDFHEEIYLYMKDGDIQLVKIYLDDNLNLDSISNHKSTRTFL